MSSWRGDVSEFVARSCNDGHAFLLGGQDPALRVVLQELVREDNGHHRVNHGHGPGHDARVVAAFEPDLDLLALAGDSVLLHGDGRSRLERDVENDVLPV